MAHVGPLRGINGESLEGVAQNVFVRQEARELPQNLVGGLDKEGTGQRTVEQMKTLRHPAVDPASISSSMLMLQNTYAFKMTPVNRKVSSNYLFWCESF